MNASTATADRPLQQAWLPVSRIQAGRLAARPRERAHPGAPGWAGAIGDILFQVCLASSRLRVPVSHGVVAVSSRTVMNNVGQNRRAERNKRLHSSQTDRSASFDSAWALLPAGCLMRRQIQSLVMEYVEGSARVLSWRTSPPCSHPARCRKEGMPSAFARCTSRSDPAGLGPGGTCASRLSVNACALLEFSQFTVVPTVNFGQFQLFFPAKPRRIPRCFR
jgi:hypothetical protein